MAPLLRHPIGESSAGSLPLSKPLTHPVRSTLVSHEGLHGDHSFLLIRERPGPVPSGDQVILRGDFGAPARGRLAAFLAALPVADRQPLYIDLRRVTSLDEGCLRLLLRARRSQAAYRSVIFQVAEAGPVRETIGLLTVGKSLGVQKSLRPKPMDALPSRLPAQCSKTVSSKGGPAPSVQPVQ